MLAKRFWPFWASFEPFRPNFWPDLAFYISYSDFLCKIHTQGLKLSGIVVLFGPVGPCIWFWPFWTSFGPIRPNFWPELAFYTSYSDFVCTVNIQGLKLSGKIVLFGP